MSLNCVDDNLSLQSRIIACIENELLKNIFKKEFMCLGCVQNRNSQIHHECLTIRDLHKFERLSDYMFLCMNFNEIVNNFLKQISQISEKFQREFNLDYIRDVLFKIPSDL